MYHIVLKNTAASAQIAYRHANSALAPHQYFQPLTYGWTKMHTTDSGATWTGKLGCIPSVRLEMLDGSFEGFAYEDSGLFGGDDNHVYGNTELGTEFTTPAQCTLRVIGVAMCAASASGTLGAVGAARYRLRLGTNRELKQTTHNIPEQQFGATMTSGQTGWKAAFFPAAVEIPPQTLVTVTCSATAGSTSNYHRLGAIKCKNDTASKGLWPFSPQKARFDGMSSWANDSTMVYPFLLLLDYGDEFAGSGLITHPGMTGGIRG